MDADGDDTKEINADDFSGITFDNETKTFSGLHVGQQQVEKNSLASHLWYSHGFPLSMAGKSNGTNLVMKPCLALFKLQVAAASMPASYYLKTETYTSSYSVNHDHTYSAVRGFNLYQKGSSTKYSSGEYTVQVANDGSLTTTSVDNANKKEYRQISQADKLVSDTNYLMCLIPGGSVSSLLIDFLGYKDNSGGLDWDAVYTMRKNGSLTVAPGSYVDLGTLNPLGLKKAKNEADDEAYDEANQSFTAAITIDGDMSDWDPSNNANLTTNYASQTGNSNFKELKVAYDKLYIYLYIKRNRVYTLWGSNQAYYYFFFDTDNDSTNGVTKDGAKYDYGFYFYPFAGTKGDNEATAVPGFASSPTSTSVASGFTYGGGIAVTFAGTYDSTDVEIEAQIARSSLGIDKNDVINLCGYGNKSADSSPYTKITIEITN